MRFCYPARPDVEVLRSVTASLRKGKTVALVGPSGSGKTTIVQLLQRLYDPQRGAIVSLLHTFFEILQLCITDAQLFLHYFHSFMTS